METCSKVFSRLPPPPNRALKKAIGEAKQQSRHQNISNFSACKAQSNQRKIRIVFFKHEKRVFKKYSYKSLFFLNSSWNLFLLKEDIYFQLLHFFKLNLYVGLVLVFFFTGTVTHINRIAIYGSSWCFFQALNTFLTFMQHCIVRAGDHFQQLMGVEELLVHGKIH